MPRLVPAPDSVRVAGKDYTMVPAASNGLGADKYGYVDLAQQEIVYDTTNHRARQKDTVFHEVIHCCEDAAGIDITEPAVKALATLLFGVFHDNPPLVKWLTAKH